MTDKRIVYATPTGVVIITPNQRNRMPEESEEAFLKRVWERNVECAAQPRQLPVANIIASAEAAASEGAASEGETLGEAIDRALAKAQAEFVPGPMDPDLHADTPYIVVDYRNLPADRSARDRWRIVDGKVISPEVST